MYLVHIQRHQTVIRALDKVDISVSIFAYVTLHMPHRRTALICTLENKALSACCLQNKIPTWPNRYDFAVSVYYIVPV